jgi:hypothetical protein
MVLDMKNAPVTIDGTTGTMTIGTLAWAGVNPRTLRYDERLGLLAPDGAPNPLARRAPVRWDGAPP